MQNNHTRARLVNNAVNNGEGNYCHTRSGPRFLLLFTLLLRLGRNQRQNEREIHTTQKCLCGESYDFSVSSSLAFSFGYCFTRNFHAVKASCALLLAFFAKFNQTSLHWILLHNKLQHHSYYLLHYALAFARLANAEASLSPTWSRRFRRTISIPTHTQTGSTKSGADQSRNFAS